MNVKKHTMSYNLTCNPTHRRRVQIVGKQRDYSMHARNICMYMYSNMPRGLYSKLATIYGIQKVWPN